MVNSAEHDRYRDKLSNIRKRLYIRGEMGYIDAQNWGFEEQKRKNKTSKNTL